METLSTSAPSGPTEVGHFVTHTTWDGYLRIREGLADNVHVTYSRGRLELMAPSYRHENRKSVLGMLLESYMALKGISFNSGGSTTFKKEELDQGLEADECYWIEPGQPGKHFEGLDELPAPDLVVEVEVSQTVIDRLPLLAALGVMEVWRFKAGRQLLIYQLVGGQYEQRELSPVFPELPIEELLLHLELASKQTHSAALVSWINLLQHPSK